MQQIAYVSIHTPTKGVTAKRKVMTETLNVSIHTPTKGVTRFCKFYFSFIWCFNPHTHEGCDCLRLTPVILLFLFQSTHPRRVWRINFDSIQNNVWFQSTHPRRVWRFSKSHNHPKIRFNPHTHEGCDYNTPVMQRARLVSIHTPTKGVTTRCRWQDLSFSVSIHTPTKGVTLILRWSSTWASVSIHTPTKGVTFYHRQSKMQE